MILRFPLIALFITLSTIAHSDHCKDSVAVLGTELRSSSEREPVSRETLLKDLALLYSNGLQDNTIMAAFEVSLKELADRETKTFSELHREVELLSFSRSALADAKERREEAKKKEQAELYEGLQPYLEAISEDDREVIERELIYPGLIIPRSVGEVEFQFREDHSFVMGNQGLGGHWAGEVKTEVFNRGQDFAIGQAPVTQLLFFLAALGAKGVDPTPSKFKTGMGGVVLRLSSGDYSLKPNHPVEKTTLLDAMAHADRVRRITGGGYGLPNEKQWEFSNRAGSTGKFHFDDVSNLVDHGWIRENADVQTHAVGELLPNAFFLYDTHGNVWEWTSSSDGEKRIIRGGSWDGGWGEAASSYRAWANELSSTNCIGFRLMRDTPCSLRPAHTFVFGETQSVTNRRDGNPGGRP
jgi:hypothetical protein